MHYAVIYELTAYNCVHNVYVPFLRLGLHFLFRSPAIGNRPTFVNKGYLSAVRIMHPFFIDSERRTEINFSS